MAAGGAKTIDTVGQVYQTERQKRPADNLDIDIVEKADKSQTGHYQSQRRAGVRQHGRR